jgi:hypothetical protein
VTLELIKSRERILFRMEKDFTVDTGKWSCLDEYTGWFLEWSRKLAILAIGTWLNGQGRG